MPPLLPWLVVLALLVLPSNRNARAWLIWLPLVGLVLLCDGLQSALAALHNGFGASEELSALAQAAGSVPFGLTASWLLGAGLARRGRVLGLALMVLAFAAASLLAFFVSPVCEQARNLEVLGPEVLGYLALFAVGTGVVYVGALSLTRWRCRRRFGWLRVSLWLPLWLWVMWAVAGVVFGGVVTWVSGGDFEWADLLPGLVILALVSLVLVLPFLLLSFTSSFYRERFKRVLRLPVPESSPAAATPAPVAEQAIQQ